MRTIITVKFPEMSNTLQLQYSALDKLAFLHMQSTANCHMINEQPGQESGSLQHTHLYLEPQDFILCSNKTGSILYTQLYSQLGLPTAHREIVLKNE